MRDVSDFSINVGNRVLNVLETGIPDGIPILFFHGTPGSKLISTPSIVDAEDLDFYKGMGESNIAEFNAAVESRESLSKNIEEQSEGMLNTNPEAMVKSMKFILCPADAQAMTLDFAEYFIKSCREGIGQRGDGWIDDDFAFTNPWGFQLNCISIPVLVMHGEQDQMVPFPHGQWIADQIPGVERSFYQSDGHITLKDKIPEVHDWLLSKI